MAVSHKIKHSYHNIQHSCVLVFKGVENVYIHKNLHMNIYSSFIPNSPNLKAIKITFSRWNDKLQYIQTRQYRMHAQSCLTLCNPMDCSPPSSSVYGILQARILERVAMDSSRGSSPPRDWTCISCIGKLVIYHLATWEALTQYYLALKRE